MNNRQEVIERIREIGLSEGSHGISKYVDENGIDITNLSMGFYVQDTSKVNWKPNSHFIKLFSSGLSEVMKKDFTIEMFGLLMLLASYLDYQNNYLVNKDGEYLTQKDIMKIAKWGKTKTVNMISQLVENDMLIKMPQENDNRKSKFFMNPNLFYRGKQIDKDIKAYYDIKNHQIKKK
jgi:DNA-binding MarR family transcriptional regulator